MGYRERAQEFLDRSREERRRLEEEIRTIGEIIERLESLLAGASRPEDDGATSPDSLSISPTLPFPERELPAAEGNGRIPVGEAAEAYLRNKGEPASLDEIFRALSGRPEVAPSTDLKNAIRVALIRRRPRVVSERRGWFRYAGEPAPS